MSSKKSVKAKPLNEDFDPEQFHESRDNELVLADWCTYVEWAIKNNHITLKYGSEGQEKTFYYSLMVSDKKPLPAITMACEITYSAVLDKVRNGNATKNLTIYGKISTEKNTAYDNVTDEVVFLKTIGSLNTYLSSIAVKKHFTTCMTNLENEGVSSIFIGFKFGKDGKPWFTIFNNGKNGLSEVNFDNDIYKLSTAVQSGSICQITFTMKGATANKMVLKVTPTVKECIIMKRGTGHKASAPKISKAFAHLAKPDSDDEEDTPKATSDVDDVDALIKDLAPVSKKSSKKVIDDESDQKSDEDKPVDKSKKGKEAKSEVPEPVKGESDEESDGEKDEKKKAPKKASKKEPVKDESDEESDGEKDEKKKAPKKTSKKESVKDESESDPEETPTPKKPSKKAPVKDESDEESEGEKNEKKKAAKKAVKKAPVKDESDDEPEETPTPKKSSKKAEKPVDTEEDSSDDEPAPPKKKTSKK